MTRMPTVFDIETVADHRAESYFAAKEYEAPANYKDPLKIAEAIAEKRKKDVERAALFWWTGRIICICAQLPDGQMVTAAGDNEKEVLCEFFNKVPADAWMIAKSGDYFDIPYLVGRALYHDIGIPDWLRPTRPVQDVNHIFGFARTDQVTSLADYAFGLAIAGKLADGADVAGMYAEGRWDDIKSYCAQDVAIAAEIMKRWVKTYPMQ